MRYHPARIGSGTIVGLGDADAAGVGTGVAGELPGDAAGVGTGVAGELSGDADVAGVTGAVTDWPTDWERWVADGAVLSSPIAGLLRLKVLCPCGALKF